MILCCPFVERNENITVTILEIGFTLASFLVPFFVESVNEIFLADVFIYTLMGTSLVTSLVSAYYYITTCY